MAYRDEVLADSPVGYWRLGESSGTNANDETANNRDGTYVNAPTLAAAGALAGDANTAVAFNGVDEYATIADAAAFSVPASPGAFTVEAWVKLANSTDPETYFFGKAGSGYEWALGQQENTLSFTLWQSDGTAIVGINETVSGGVWYHYVVVVDANARTVKAYVNGTIGSNVAWGAGDPSDTASLVYIGVRGDGVGYFEGTLDELAIYAAALTEARIDAHYDAGTTAVTAKAGSDAGVGADTVTAQTPGTVKNATDTGAGVESRTITDTLAAETGSGAELVVSDTTAKVATDSGTGSEVATRDTGVAAAAVPTVTARVDWWATGAFTDPLDDVSAWLLSDRLTRGRSTDYGSDAIGSRTFRLRNDTGRFTPDRNWHDNPSFEVDTTGWSTAAIAGLIAAGTSIAKVVDNAPSAGTAAGSAVLPATLNAGVVYAIPHKFRGGVAYRVEVYLKSMSGSTSVEAGIGSSGRPGDRAVSSGTITTSWAAQTFVWTPSVDRDDVVFFVRTGAASAATVRIDRVQINPGSAVNNYLEAPTKGQLIPGRPVHLYATWAAASYPLFFGRIERISPIPLTHDVEVVCYDPLRRYQETDVIVPANDYSISGQVSVLRTARDLRVAVLDDAERGVRNLIANPSFEANTNGWETATYGGTLTRITSDFHSGAACGEYVATAASQRVQYAVPLSPIFVAGQTYRFSVYLRVASGTADWEIGIYTDPATQVAGKTVTATTAWTRHTLTLTLPATVSASTLTGSPRRPTIYVKALTPGTIRIDAVSVTRGQLLHPYADAGTGRWPNWVGNGGFDGGDLAGWYDGWKNLVGNPSFETDTSGWVTTADAFHSAGVINRMTSEGKFGSAYLGFSNGIAGNGAHYVLPGTFKAGVPYGVSAWFRVVAGSSVPAVGIGSNGTPTDFATAGVTALATWAKASVVWTPTADRSDVHVYLRSGDGVSFDADGVQVHRRDQVTYGYPDYSDTGPGGGGSFVDTASTALAIARYGSRSQSLVTPATATAGRVYDFSQIGSYFVAGQPYTLSVWLRPSSSMPYKVGIGANKGDGTWDEASTTGTAPANVWTQVTVTWTPSADRSSATPYGAVLYAWQTDATARTFYLDGVRVIPGSSADDFEMAEWVLGAEPDVFAPAATLDGTALSALQRLNRLVLSRHFVRPTMTSPFYEYVVGSRDDLQSKPSQETIIDTGPGGVEDLSPWQLDRAAIVNVVAVTFPGGVEHYSDEASINRYGARPGQLIDGAAFYVSRAPADLVGPALIARYKDPRARPQLWRSQLFPNLLARQVDDLISVSADRLKVYRQPYLIVIWELVILEAGLVWRAKYGLEEMP